MDQHPNPNTYTVLTGNIEQTVLTYDPILMGSVQPVPAPPSIKPQPPRAPPPPNATVYNPIKEINKHTNNFFQSHNEPVSDDNTDTDNHSNSSDFTFNQANIDYGQSLWDGNNAYKLYHYNKFDPKTGQYSIGDTIEPPNKKRKLSVPINSAMPNTNSDKDFSDRYSLQSLGFQPLAARALIEQLDSRPKLRYSEEFHRNINSYMELQTKNIVSNNKTVQQIFPTSNGRTKNYIFTECGINPNDKSSVNRLRAHALSKSINTLIFSKQKQNLDTQSESVKTHKKNDILTAAQQKSVEIARKLGFIPEFLKKTNDAHEATKYGHEDGEIKAMDAMSKKMFAFKSPKVIVAKNMSVSAADIAKAKELLNVGLAVPPPLIKHTPFTQFECRSILKSDGSEYGKDDGHKLDNVLRKYDSNFRPMFPITNKEYRFSIVSDYGFKLLNKYGYKCGDGLGKHKQGITTFPRLNGQNGLRGIDYSKRNRNNLQMGFIHCVCCDKSFCGAQNLFSHCKCKKHLKNVRMAPNNLSLLCVQCQLQFANVQKIKEHFMLVLHDTAVNGISAFVKELKTELLEKQRKYIESIKTKHNPFKDDRSEVASDTQSVSGDMSDICGESKEEIKSDSVEPQISLPLPQSKQDTQQKTVTPTPMPQMPQMPVMPNPNMGQTYYNNYYANYYQNYAKQYQYAQNSYANYYAQYQTQQQLQMQMNQTSQIASEIPINRQVCNDIKHKIYTLGLKLPMAVPTVPWIYCPICKSFYTSFSKFNAHYSEPRHATSMAQLDTASKEKMKQLSLYIQEKQLQYVNQCAANQRLAM